MIARPPILRSPREPALTRFERTWRRWRWLAIGIDASIIAVFFAVAGGPWWRILVVVAGALAVMLDAWIMSRNIGVVERRHGEFEPPRAARFSLPVQFLLGCVLTLILAWYGAGPRMFAHFPLAILLVIVLLIGTMGVCACFARRTGKTLYCARCRYQFGTIDDIRITLCPECGSAWLGPGGRTRGRTRPRWWLLAVTAVQIAVFAWLIGQLLLMQSDPFVRDLKRTLAYSWYPSFALVAEAERGKRPGAAWDVLMRRDLSRRPANRLARHLIATDAAITHPIYDDRDSWLARTAAAGLLSRETAALLLAEPVLEVELFSRDGRAMLVIAPPDFATRFDLQRGEHKLHMLVALPSVTGAAGQAAAAAWAPLSRPDDAPPEPLHDADDEMNSVRDNVHGLRFRVDAGASTTSLTVTIDYWLVATRALAARSLVVFDQAGEAVWPDLVTWKEKFTVTREIDIPEPPATSRE